MVHTVLALLTDLTRLVAATRSVPPWIALYAANRLWFANTPAAAGINTEARASLTEQAIVAPPRTRQDAKTGSKCRLGIQRSRELMT